MALPHTSISQNANFFNPKNYEGGGEVKRRHDKVVSSFNVEYLGKHCDKMMLEEILHKVIYHLIFISLIHICYINFGASGSCYTKLLQPWRPCYFVIFCIWGKGGGRTAIKRLSRNMRPNPGPGI